MGPFGPLPCGSGRRAGRSCRRWADRERPCVVPTAAF